MYEREEKSTLYRNISFVFYTSSLKSAENNLNIYII